MAEAADNYLVQIAHERWISSYVENGKVVEQNQTICVGPAMARRLKMQTFLDPRTNEDKPVFRDATEGEREAYIHRLENLDAEDADPSLIAEAARAEARELGMVERSEEKEQQRLDKEEEDMQPKTSRRRRKATES